MLWLLWDSVRGNRVTASASGTAAEDDIYCCDERLQVTVRVTPDSHEY